MGQITTMVKVTEPGWPKTGHAVTRMKRHIKSKNILAENYLWNEMEEANQTLRTD